MIKFYVITAFKISALLYSSDLKTLIGVDHSALTAAFALSLLSDPPRVFNSSWALTLSTGRPGIIGSSVRAGRQDFRAVDLACLRLAQGAPGFSLLSERHGEGAAAQGLELSSQEIGLLRSFLGYGFGGCRCRLGLRRLGALWNELGVFAGEGRLEELFDRMAGVLPYLIAMTSLATVVASRWLAGASTRLTTTAT
jgi:hypothetical protein